MTAVDDQYIVLLIKGQPEYTSDNDVAWTIGFSGICPAFPTYAMGTYVCAARSIALATGISYTMFFIAS
ncbi:hypothetical protein TNCV_1979211 [Trichonephila clavipes]|nr:hypothetical protein TNCV_1979211 [Trichonephila clavipes]